MFSELRPFFHALLRGTRRRKHRLLERHLGYSTFAQATGLYGESLEDRTMLAAPHPFELSSLNGMSGFSLDGIDAGDESGTVVSSAGDINGDGFDDLLISAPWGDPNSVSNAGESYVIFGQSSGLVSSFDLNSLDGTNGFAIHGISDSDRSGVSVAAAGDVDGDGFDDLIIGAYRGDPNGTSAAGESYVVFGQPSGFSPVIDLSSLDGTNGFAINGIDSFDYSGRSVSGAGDVNGDGLDDLIIGAYSANPNGRANAGESYVVFGQSTGFPAAFDLRSLDGINGFEFRGRDHNDKSGFALSAAGDVNGDGFGDLIIGAYGAFPAGESIVVFGQADGLPQPIDPRSLDGSNGFVISGVNLGGRSGRSVSSAGDVNGDGFDDLIIGALSASPNGNNSAGESYVVFGQSTGFPCLVRSQHA